MTKKFKKFQVEEHEQRFEMRWKEPTKVEVIHPNIDDVSTTVPV